MKHRKYNMNIYWAVTEYSLFAKFKNINIGIKNSIKRIVYIYDMVLLSFSIIIKHNIKINITIIQPINA